MAARLRALLRRAEGRASTQLTVGRLSLDSQSRELLLDGEPVALTRRELALLERLMRANGRVVSKAQLESDLYGWEEGVESNSLEVHVHHLRRKLGKELIRTQRGLGYRVSEL